VDILNSRACRSLLSLVVALVLAGFCGTAAAEPRVSPLADGGVHTFDEAVTTKYQLFNAPAGITHAGGVMSWSYNDANRPASITKASVIAQIQASMAKWSAVCKITFVQGADTTNGFSSSDGVNVIGWDATNTVITAPTTGITTDAWNGSNTIVDADIRLNAAYTATYSPFSNFDATVTHEVGHAIGLQHSDVANQVMSGPPLTSYDGLSALGADDIAGCVHLYGAAGGGGPPPDTQAPSVPTGLAATANSTTQINLAWNASTDNVGVTGYKIFQSGTLLGTVTGAGAAVTGLSPGTLYSFTVSACDAASNCSAQSASASATTLSVDTQPPTVPMGLVATAAGASQVNLAWNASTDNVGVANYEVFQGATQLGTVPGTSASVTGLLPGTMYGFTVSACDAAGNCSAQSASASATTTGSPPPPTCTGSQPPNDTQVLACPAGQTGSIFQARSYSCIGSTWTPGAYQTTSNTCSNGTTIQSYQDMWWAGQQENGWGLTITQHQDALFLAWYIYDSSGNPLWVVLPSGQWNAAHTTYSGALYIPSGSWYGNYQVGNFTANASVGSASIAFTSTSTGTLTYSVNGVSGSKSVSRMAFGLVNTAPITNYMDMWWGGSAENGWGVVLTQQYHNIFAAWYTYDTSGRTTWLVMPDGTWTGNTYTGALYRTRGTPVVGATYNASALVVTQAGTLTLTFTDANTATMTYTVDGLTQTKPITRLPF
jgi:chitinase